MEIKQCEIFSPYTEKKIGSLPLQTEEEVMGILEKKYSFFKNREYKSFTSEIIPIFEKFVQLLVENKIELMKLATEEGGKPLKDSLIEVDRAINGVKIAISEIMSFHGREIPMELNLSSSQRFAFTKRYPRGVVLAISAFNHPVNLIIHQVLPALAVGCPVLVKPALETPFSCKYIIDLLYKSGLSSSWCEFILCENSVSEKLAQDSRVSFLSFIGSANVGWSLRSKLARGTLCSLEHGGIAPAIIDKSVDLDKIISSLVKGAFYHAGQVCVSLQRAIIHEEIFESFKEKLIEKVKTLKVGNPLLEDTDVGPIIRKKDLLRIHTWVEEAVKDGAKILIGGEVLSKNCYLPTVLEKPPLSCKVSNQEVFGPVLCLYSFRRIEDAIKMANLENVSFQASLFSNDYFLIMSALEKLEGTTLLINDHTAFRVDWMPFGGQKHSGMGVGGIGPAMKELTFEKLFVFNKN